MKKKLRQTNPSALKSGPSSRYVTAVQKRMADGSTRKWFNWEF